MEDGENEERLGYVWKNTRFLSFESINRERLNRKPRVHYRGYRTHFRSREGTYN